MVPRKRVLRYRNSADFRYETGEWQGFNGIDSTSKDTKPKGARARAYFVNLVSWIDGHWKHEKVEVNGRSSTRRLRQTDGLVRGAPDFPDGFSFYPALSAPTPAPVAKVSASYLLSLAEEELMTITKQGINTILSTAD